MRREKDLGLSAEDLGRAVIDSARSTGGAILKPLQNPEFQTPTETAVSLGEGVLRFVANGLGAVNSLRQMGTDRVASLFTGEEADLDRDYERFVNRLIKERDEQASQGRTILGDAVSLAADAITDDAGLTDTAGNVVSGVIDQDDVGAIEAGLNVATVASPRNVAGAAGLTQGVVRNAIRGAGNVAREGAARSLGTAAKGAGMTKNLGKGIDDLVQGITSGHGNLAGTTGVVTALRPTILCLLWPLHRGLSISDPRELRRLRLLPRRLSGTRSRGRRPSKSWNG